MIMLWGIILRRVEKLKNWPNVFCLYFHNIYKNLLFGERESILSMNKIYWNSPRLCVCGAITTLKYMFIYLHSGDIRMRAPLSSPPTPRIMYIWGFAFIFHSLSLSFSTRNTKAMCNINIDCGALKLCERESNEK